MFALLSVLAVLTVVALAVWAWRRAAAAAATEPRRRAWGAAEASRGAQVVLDVAIDDPDDPAVQRLVRDAAHRALAADAELDEVEVIDRAGRVLANERRPEPLPPDVAIPDVLRAPHAAPRRRPSVLGHPTAPHPRAVPEPSPEVPDVPLADRLDLPGTVRARIHDRDDGPDLVAAILEAAGHPVSRDGDLLRTGDLAIAVVDVHRDAERALNHGFLRIQSTDAARGIVLRLGFVDPATIRRREAAAMHVRHAGPDALQRMADAVAAGADPLAFVTGPATLRRASSRPHRGRSR